MVNKERQDKVGEVPWCDGNQDSSTSVGNLAQLERRVISDETVIHITLSGYNSGPASVLSWP